MSAAKRLARSASASSERVLQLRVGGVGDHARVVGGEQLGVRLAMLRRERAGLNVWAAR
jgi:hypothetical protein